MDLISRKIEENRLKTAEELRRKNAELEKANEELDHFVYSASHDLKSPLTSVLGLINVAKHDINEPTSLHYFEMIEARVNKLNSFIKDIISISRNTRTEVAQEEVDMRELIEDVITLNLDVSPDLKISFIREIELGQKLLIDKARMEIILNNLISNAIKYQLRENADKWVKIVAKMEGNHLLLEVSDNGEGIASEHLDKIYNMFFRANQHADGSGLGLYIVKNVVEKLHGHIKVESIENQGTKVSVRFKLKVGG
jgi:signal transduction histidine kinase